MGSVRRFRPGHSPFDEILHVEDDGTEWWSAREMMPLLGYQRWADGMENVIERAKTACRNTGHSHADHFRESPQMVTIGSGVQRARADYQMTRYGCYLLAMNGDPTKPEVAAAQQYFALMTRAAEKAIAVPDAVAHAARPWSIRFRETTQQHFCYVSSQCPGYFSVVSATVAQLLMMEEELIRHLLPLSPGDLPDGSIGRHWAHDRWKRSLPPSTLRAPLLLPDRNIDAQVLLYPVAEMGEYLSWLNRAYLPIHLPQYYGRKPEFRPHGELPSASAADGTCRRIAGIPANLPPHLRRQLAAVGGFCPAGKQLPGGSVQGQLFGPVR